MMATKLKTVEDEIHARDEEARALNIAQRIAAVMGEVDYVQKERKQGMNYSIVSHDAVTAKVRPLLHKHGVIYYPRGLTVGQNGNRTEAVFTVRFENIDDRTDYIDVETFGYGVDPQDKGPGKAMSYGVKYALLKVLGLETGDDPDVVQDKSANHEPADPKPTGKEKDGDYSPTALRGAIKMLVRNINGCAPHRDLDELLELDAARTRSSNAQRRFPRGGRRARAVPPSSSRSRN
jgi:hypothetical protein